MVGKSGKWPRSVGSGKLFGVQKIQNSKSPSPPLGGRGVKRKGKVVWGLEFVVGKSGKWARSVGSGKLFGLQKIQNSKFPSLGSDSYWNGGEKNLKSHHEICEYRIKAL